MNNERLAETPRSSTPRRRRQRLSVVPARPSPYADPGSEWSEASYRIRAGFDYVDSPGPGSYDPRTPRSTSARMAGSAAFRSLSAKQVVSALREMSDPGQYNPSNGTIGRESGSTSSRSGSLSARDRWTKGPERPGFAGSYDSLGRLLRGPAANYETRPNWTDKRCGKLGTNFWQSKTVREATYLKRLKTPDAIDYDVSATLKRTMGGDSMFRSRDARFKEQWLGADAPPLNHYVPANFTIAHNIKQKSKSSTALAECGMGTSSRGDLFITPKIRAHMTLGLREYRGGGRIGPASARRPHSARSSPRRPLSARGSSRSRVSV